MRGEERLKNDPVNDDSETLCPCQNGKDGLSEHLIGDPLQHIPPGWNPLKRCDLAPCVLPAAATERVTCIDDLLNRDPVYEHGVRFLSIFRKEDGIFEFQSNIIKPVLLSKCCDHLPQGCPGFRTMATEGLTEVNVAPFYDDWDFSGHGITKYPFFSEDTRGSCPNISSSLAPAGILQRPIEEMVEEGILASLNIFQCSVLDNAASLHEAKPVTKRYHIPERMGYSNTGNI